jgi:hypothetical protein
MRKKLSKKDALLSLESCINIASGAMIVWSEKKKTAKSVQEKENAKGAMDFYRSVVCYLVDKD